MQYIPENLKQVLNDRLKAGHVSKPKLTVEVDRMTFIPGYVEEVTFYDYDFVKTISETLTETEEIVVTDIAATFPLGGKTWADLNKKFTLTSNYGMRRGKMHEGTDLQTKGGPSDIVAMWDGKVIQAGWHKTAGNRVHILHESGIVTKYFHMVNNSMVVKIGQQVKAGQKLGLEGTTGNSTGRHLHVEVWSDKNATGSNTGTRNDPLPYLKGEKKIKGNAVQKKNTVTSEVTELEFHDEKVAGKVIFEEKFKSQSWEKNQAYNNFTPQDAGVTFKNVDLKNGFYRPTWKFTAASSVTARVAINLTMTEEGFFKFNFSGNFSGGDGDHIRVFVNGNLLYNTSQFNGIGKPTTSPNIKVPAGNVEIFIIILYYGKMGATAKEFSLHDLKVQELDSTISVPREVTNTIETELPDNQTEKFEYSEKEIKIQLQVGRFVYQDTIVLPNVQQCEVQRTMDQEASDAKLTISNPDGAYGPDYNPYYFPDLSAKNAQSPYSYTLPGGFHVGVLAENTPIRIYMGYGHEDSKPLRIFTGLIDSVSMNSVEGTLDIAARDMYKKIINTVLMTRKIYGKEQEPITKDVPNTATTVASVESLSRTEQIYYWAFKKCEEFGLPKDSAYFLLAICRHETRFGEAGQGLPPRNMILGYGSFNTNPDYSYGGIEKQMHYGAKRVKDALKSKGFLPKSFDDVKYFWKGGDYGNYQWATDTNWPNSVWAVYKQITGEKSKYQAPTLGKPVTTTHTEVVGKSTGEQWLKTAIIQDLIAEAGMFGWRSSVDDMKYPDAVIEESYVIEVNPKTGKVVKALPAEEATEDKVFETVPIESIKTTGGYLNPFVEPAAKTFIEFQWRIAEAIQDLIKDTNYRSYCDRYGTYRLELLNLEGPVVAEFKDDSNLISLSKTVDHTRSRSHMVVFHDGFKENGEDKKDRVFASFIDKELLLELKGEVRTMTVAVPWAKTDAMKSEVAKKMFFQMKQMSRTLQASVPGNPALDILDRVRVVDRSTGTSATYYIKSIRDSFDVEAGYIQIIDLTWAAVDQIMQVQGLTVNLEPPVYEPPAPPAPKCEPWTGKVYKYGMKNDAGVKKIQNFLIGKGHKLKYGADGHFGSETQSAVKSFQKSQNLASDGIVGVNTWNKMFCPTATVAKGKNPTAKSITIRGTRSWRTGRAWHNDNDYIYQGEWENFGHHKGFIFLDHKAVQATLKGKKIKSVKLYLERYPKQGVHSTQYPTFWLHNLTGATGTPSMVSGTSWKSNVGWASAEKKWVTLPNSFGEALRDGKAKGIGIYTPSKTPYIYFYGASKVKLEIETD